MAAVIRRNNAPSQMHGRRLLPLILLTLGFAGAGNAQTGPDEPDNLVHYSYSALLGTGYYKVGERRVGVLRIPFSYRIREPESRSRPGIRVLLPITLGVHNFEIKDAADLRLDDIVTATILPGVELNYRLSERWEVDPAVHLGYGRDTTNNESSLVWGAAVSSRYELKSRQPGLTLGSEAIWTGYNPDEGSSDSIVRLAVGLDVRTWTGWTFGNKNLFVGTHVIGYYYPVSFTIESIEPDRIKTNAELEFGLAIGAEPLLSVMGYDLNRLGLAYRFSEETRAIILTTRFPF